MRESLCVGHPRDAVLALRGDWVLARLLDDLHHADVGAPVEGLVDCSTHVEKGASSVSLSRFVVRAPSSDFNDDLEEVVVTPHMWLRAEERRAEESRRK